MSIMFYTNHVPRWLIDAHELTDKERQQFHYLEWDRIDAGHRSATFFRFKGKLYDLAEFVSVPDALKPWDGYSHDSAFSGVVVKLVDDDKVIVGQYFS